jgi:AcrR family transcriptional regulator
LVQRHFGSKPGLIKAVDDHVMAVIAATIAEPRPGPPGDPVAEVGQRVTSLIGQHPHVVDYLGRALIDGAAIGSAIFDALVATGKARWDQSRSQQLVRCRDAGKIDKTRLATLTKRRRVVRAC